MGQRVNQADLIAATAVELGIPVPQAKAVVDQFLEHAKGTLLKGNQVLLSGFMSLGIRKYKSRVGRNPQTGDKVKVPAGKRLFMKASASFKNVLNISKTKKKAASKKTASKKRPPAKKAAPKKAAPKKRVAKKTIRKAAPKKRVAKKRVAKKTAARKTIRRVAKKAAPKTRTTKRSARK